jgi:serine/threonine protein phosphatase PrpC
MSFEVATLTDTGRARPHNEDSVDYSVPQDPQLIDTKGGIYLVADGMGGHQAGEVASSQAIKLVIDQYYSDLTHDVGTSLVRAYKAANRFIYDEAQSDPAKAGMGTTLVAAAIVGRKVYVASVGDSRAYLIGQGRITQITEDHSWVQEQIRAGLLTREQARLHPQRNVVTRALGSKPSVEVDLFEGQLADGDALLLCSDGMSGLVEDWEIEAIVRDQSAQDAVRSLVAKANERGGMDNITVLMVDTRKEKTTVVAAPPAPSEGKKTFPMIPVLAGVAVVAIILLVAGILLVPSLLKGQETATATAGIAATTASAASPDTPVSPTQTPVPSPSGTSLGQTETPVLSPTVTLVPTRTSTPTVTSEPQSTQRPAVTSTGTSAPTLPAAQLVAPKEQDAESSTGEVTFRWTYPQPLKAGQAFQVLIWKEGDTQHLGAAEPTLLTQQSINLDAILVSRGGPGQYYRWSVVVVVKDTGEGLSAEAGPWRLYYIGPRGTPEPTVGPSPQPPPTGQVPPTVQLPTLLPTVRPLATP